MGKLIDLTGQTFGYLTVIEKTDKKIAKKIVWKCKCKCGNEYEVTGDHLRRGCTKSCGCLRIESNQKRFNDIKGQQFGYLTVIEKTNKRDNRGYIIWKCKCQCGNEIEISGDYLRTGNTRSCGCLKSKGEEKISQILRNNNILFEKEKIFDNCKDKNVLPFDFYVDNKYIIEYDGEQHFKSTGGWSTEQNLKYIQEHDQIKNGYCKNNNIPIIRIPYTHLNELCLEDLLLETSQFIVI